MTVRDLINKLIEMPLEDDIGMAIIKHLNKEETESVIYVGDKGTLTVRSPQLIGDKGVWIESEIREIKPNSEISLDKRSK